MKLLTVKGYRPVSERSWPFAGLTDRHSPWDQGSLTIDLVELPTGEKLYASYEQLRRENPWVFACQEIIARGLARMPLHVYAYTTDGNRERVRANTVRVGAPTGPERLARLLQYPSPGVSGMDLFYATLIDKLTYGNALWYIEVDGLGLPSAIYHVPWKWVKVVEGDHDRVERYEVRPSWRTKAIIPENAVHFGTMTDQPIAISPLEPLARSLALLDAIKRHLVAYFKNQAAPSGNLKLSPQAQDAEIRAALAQVKRLYTSPENAGKVVVTTGDWQSVGYNPQHSQVIELSKAGREEICAVYNVPPPLVGILDRAIMSNVRELTEWYIRQTLGPHASSFEDDIMSQLVSRFPSMSQAFVEFQLEEQLRADPEARAESFQRMLSVYTVDELRQRENLAPLGIEGHSDTVWLPPGATRLGAPDPGEGGAAPFPEDQGPPPDEDDDDDE
jgi:HK97 family phage portal protein